MAARVAIVVGGKRWAIAWLLCAAAAQIGWGAPPAPANFQTASQAWTILRRNCLKCHNAKTKDGKLDLRNRAHLLDEKRKLVKRGPEGTVNLDDSKLWKMLRIGEMPPYDEEPLTTDELETLRAWIAAGAPPEMPDR